MLRILSFCLIIFFFSCQEKSKTADAAATKAPAKAKTAIELKAEEATKRFPAGKIPEKYKFKPVELTGNEIPSKELKYKDGANGKRVAHHKGKPFTGVATYVLPNGSIFTYETFKDGLKNGPYRSKLMNTDDNGKPDNSYAVGTTINGVNDGLYVEYYDNEGGSIKYVYHYDKGVKVGQWNSYYRNGSQWTRRDFKNDVIDGKVLVWDEDGTLGKEHTYQNGRLTFKEFYFEENK